MTRSFRHASSALVLLVTLVLATPVLADSADDEAAKASAAAEAGDFKTASAAATRAFSLAMKERGKDDKSVGPLALQAGKYLVEAGNLENASKAFGMAYKNAMDSYGPASMKCSEPLLMLAATAERSGETPKARDFHERHITLVERATGADSLETANALLAAAELDFSSSNYGIARTRLNQAIRGFKKAGADSLPLLADCQFLMARAFIKDDSRPRENLPAGGEALREALTNYETIYPQGSPKLIAAYGRILSDIVGSPIAQSLAGRMEERLAEHKKAAGQ